MTNQDIRKVYGNEGENLKTFISPFELYLSWQTTTSTNKITLHKKYGQSLIDALQEILDTFGIEFINEMRLNIYGGAYNNRLMRGSKTKKSLHSWGIAIDFDPKNNDLKGVNKRFLEPQYKKAIDILEKYGWYNLGKYKGYDTMHFQVIKPT